MKTRSMPHIAIYTRVSSEEQVSEGFSLETQRLQCVAKLDEIYGENLYEAQVFSDEGVSGKLGLYDPAKPKKRYRPELTRLKHALDLGEFDAVCIYGLDRLSRNYSLLPKLIEDVFSDGSVELLSVREGGMECVTPTGRAMAQLLNASNALLCDIGSQVVKDASFRRRKEGYPIRAPMGWKWKAEKDANGRRGIEPDPEKLETVKFIISEFLAGKGARTIAKELMGRGIKTAKGTERWYKKLVVDIILQPQHYGLIHIGNGEHVKGTHYESRFFDPEDFEEVKRLLKQRTSEPAQFDTHPEYLVGGLVECKHCHVKMRGRRGRGRRRVHACQAEAWQQQPGCTRNSIRADWVEREVLEHIHSFLNQPQLLKAARKEALGLVGREGKRLQEDKRRLEDEIAKLHRKSLRWSERLNDEEITIEEYRQYKDELLRQQDEAAVALAEVQRQLESSARGSEDWAAIEQALSDMERLWEQLTPAERKQILREVIERVSVGKLEDGSFEIRVKPRFGPEHLVHVPSLRGQTLSKRQMEAYWLLAQGMTRKQVAKRLGQTVGGLNCTLMAGRKRLGAASVQEAIEQGGEIIEPYVKWLDLQGREQRLPGRGPQWPQFTIEERNVLMALAEDAKGPEIAERLGIKPSTVYVHLHNMREKVGAGTNKQLLEFAKEAGMLAEAALMR
ncbi:MAG: recombinase family protein [Armatimonadia bacterium]